MLFVLHPEAFGAEGKHVEPRAAPEIQRLLGGGGRPLAGRSWCAWEESNLRPSD